MRDGRIAAVRQGTSDAAGVLRAAVVMPGLIDARTTAGLSGLIDADDDTDDRGGPVRPELRAQDGFDLSDPLLEMALRSGVAIVHAGPGDANSIGGQSGLFLTSAPTVQAATVRAPAAVIVSLTEDAKTTYAERNRLPTTRMANVGLVRQAFVDARRHAAAAKPSPDAGADVLAKVLADSLPAFIAAHRADEIATALRIADEFDRSVVITGATEAAWVTQALAASGAHVVLEPADLARAAAGEATAPHAALALRAAGVPFSFATGDAREGATLLDVARDAVRAGLPADAALAALPEVRLGVEEQACILQGQPVFAAGPGGAKVRMYGADGRFLGVGQMTAEGRRLAPDRIMIELAGAAHPTA